MGAGLLLYDRWAGQDTCRGAGTCRGGPRWPPPPRCGPIPWWARCISTTRRRTTPCIVAYVARTAAAHGAAIATRVRVTGFDTDESGRVTGVQARDEVGGGALQIRCMHMVAAVGAATDRLLELATGRPHNELRVSKGVHVLVPRSSIPMRSGLFMRTEKSIFHAIPWGPGHWLLGDTDTEWGEDPEQPVASRADVYYLLAKVNSVLVDPITPRDIHGVFAGVRPLVKAAGTADTTRLSREHRLFGPRPGMTVIAGGKYTTYRVMARDAVDRAARGIGRDVPPSSHRAGAVGRSRGLPAARAARVVARTRDPAGGAPRIAGGAAVRTDRR